MSRNPTFVAVVAVTLAAIASSSGCARDRDIEVLTTPQHEAANLPFSEAVAYGNLIFVSGQIGARPGETRLVEGGVQAQTRQAMHNIAAVLERHGSSLDKVVKCTVFLGDMSQWADMNVAYLEVLGDHRPARSALGANGLALGGSVEVECIAAR